MNANDSESNTYSELDSDFDCHGIILRQTKENISLKKDLYF